MNPSDASGTVPLGRTRVRSWRRLTAEGFAILASILLAFGIDAWWDGRLELAREQEILADLEAEFERNRELLEITSNGHTARIGSAMRLLRASRGSVAWPSPDSTAVLLFQAFALDAGSYDPRQGVYSSVLASGEIGLIRDDSLRYALTEWPRMLQDATEDEQWIIREVQTSIQPHLFGLLPMDAVYDLQLPRLDLSSSDRVDYPAVFEDMRLRNLLMAQVFNEEFVSAELRELDTVIEDILRRIRASQER